MTDFVINDHILTKECDELAQDIFDEVVAEITSGIADGESPADFRDCMSDRAHETADGHEWVIYTYKAHMLCAHCNVDQGEEFLEDVGMPDTPTYDSLGTMIAYGEMRARIDAE
ncbi:MAG: hypothetical protein ACPG4X_16555, partial [Pikeienuella sp.]